MASLRTLIVLLIMWPAVAGAQALSQRAIYERCHAKLARMTVQPDDPYVAQIEAGTMTAATACKNLLYLPVFNSSNRISTSLTPAQLALAKSVLRSMNDLHMSWFENKRFDSGNQCQRVTTPTVVDTLEPSYFFTRAVFDNNVNFSNAVTGNAELRAIRSVDNPARAISSTAITTSTKIGGLATSFKLTPNGDLLGIGTGQNPEVPFAIAINLDEKETSIPHLTNPKPFANRGGGLIGSQAYLLNNFPDMAPANYNLAKMPRPFAKYVFQDLLCRELPVISQADAETWAVCSGTNCGLKPKTGDKVLPFRQQPACVACHASMDQLGAVVRNYRFYTQSAKVTDRSCSLGTQNFKSIHVLPQPTTTASYSWGYEADETFGKKTPIGRFVYRPMNGGALVNVQINNLEELGTKIESLEDYYICGAKRYYRYFTGIDVSLQPMTSAQVDALPADQKYYRNLVFSLGRKFRKAAADGGFDKDPKKLIEAIMNSAEFKQKDFLISNRAKGL